MPAAYYDITIEEGSSYRLKLKFKDKDGKIVVLKPYQLTTTTGTTTTTTTVSIPAPEGFEEQWLKPGTTDQYYNVGVFAKMQVRNSVNAGIVELTPVGTEDSGPVSLFGESWMQTGSCPIELSLASGQNLTPNIKLNISSFNSRRITYGNYLYDMELIYHKIPDSGIVNYSALSEGLDKDVVVFRILQGRFIVTPAISR